MLPLVPSMTVCPGRNSPLRSAASMTPSASRSFTEPMGLNDSSFTYSAISGGASFSRRTTGVRPTVSRIFPKRASHVDYGA